MKLSVINNKPGSEESILDKIKKITKAKMNRAYYGQKANYRRLNTHGEDDVRQ